MKKVITYGTFDLFHVGHLKLLERAKSKGDYLIVGLSTDEFNKNMKNKVSAICFEDRKRILEGLRCVDLVIPEENWGQKETDIKEFRADVFVMGHDWKGKFDELKSLCEVCYLPRTRKVSSSKIKKHVTNGGGKQIKSKKPKKIKS